MPDPETIDLLLVKITNPLNPRIEGLDVQKFCHLVSKSEDGPQQAAKLLAYRIHSPQEKEALYSLTLLDLCVKSCGTPFQNEVGKFRFLNELIKLVSPKYDGAKTPAVVKQKVIELLYNWSVDVPHEPKIKEAYGMLKKQGVVKADPHYLGIRKPESAPYPHEERHNPAKNRTPFLGNEEQEKVIKGLIQSGRPEDLEKANRLIKSLVQQDERKAEQIAVRTLELEKISNNSKILKEMMEGGASSGEERELMQELAETCERLRPTLFKYAADSEGDVLDSILRSADELNQVLDLYREFMKNGGRSESEALLEIDTPSMEIPTSSATQRLSIDDELHSIDLRVPCVPVLRLANEEPIKPHQVLQSQLWEEQAPSAPPLKPRGLDDLDVLGDLMKSMPGTSAAGSMGKFQPRPVDKIPMNQMLKATPAQRQPTSFSSKDFDLLSGFASSPPFPEKSSNPVPISSFSISATAGKLGSSNGSLDDALLMDGSGEKVKGEIGLLDATDIDESRIKKIHESSNGDIHSKSPTCDTSVEVRPLGDLSISLASITPGNLPPRTVFDNRNGLTTTLHVARDRPRPDVSVLVFSTTSRNTSALSNYVMQVIIAKPCRTKLLAPSSTTIPGYSPFLPSPAITHVLLLATPNWESVNVKFALTYDLEGETISDMEEIQNLLIAE